MKASRFVIPLLVTGLIASAGGWQLQEQAADALGEARRLQNAPIPEDDSRPPSPESNQAIIDNLQRGTAIRQEIDDVLTNVRASVAALGASQDEVLEITGRTQQLLTRIARSLGASMTASRASVARLGTLGGRLSESDRLGVLILAELAELDHRLGPSVGEP